MGNRISAQAERPSTTLLRCVYRGLDQILEAKVHLKCLDASVDHECERCRSFVAMASEVYGSISRYESTVKDAELLEKAELEAEYLDGLAVDRK